MDQLTKEGILEGIDITAVTHPEHAETLKVSRNHGSTTDKGLGELPKDYRVSPADDQTNAGPGCILFEGGHGMLGGRSGITTVKEAFENKLDIRVRKGEHGLELYSSTTVQIKIPCNTLTFIIASENNPDGIAPGGLVGWFPGPAAKPVLEDAGINLGDLVVKLN
jgi:hypothetical protein